MKTLLITTLLAGAGLNAVAQTQPDHLGQAKQLVDRIDQMVSKNSVNIEHVDFNWKQLEDLHHQLMETMALDPARLDSKFIPPALEPESLTRDLMTSLDLIKHARFVAEKYKAEAVFDEYVAQIEKIIQLRKKRLYSESRRIAKKGIVEEKYNNLVNAIQDSAAGSIQLVLTPKDGTHEELFVQMQNLRNTIAEAHGLDNRSVASVQEDSGRQKLIKILFWILVPLIFLTGLCGGWVWHSKLSEQDHRRIRL